MSDYWKRASRWAWKNAWEFTSPAKILFRVAVTLALAVVVAGVLHLKRPDLAPSVWIVAGTAAALLLAYLLNLLFRAPVALDTLRGATERDLRGEVRRLTVQTPPPRHPDFRKAQIAEWIKLRGKGNRHMWLRQIVPNTENYDHFVPILRQMAGPDSSIQIIKDEEGEDGSAEIEFIVRKQFFT